MVGFAAWIVALLATAAGWFDGPSLAAAQALAMRRG